FPARPRDRARALSPQGSAAPLASGGGARELGAVDLPSSGDGERAAAPPPDRRWGRLELVHVLVLLLVTGAHWLPRLRGPIDLRYDGGVYFVLGTALARGDGYRLLNEPGEIEAIQYPPLFPAVIALHQLVLGSDDPLVVGEVLRWSSAALALCYALA